MKTLILIIALFTIVSCEIERNCTGYCYSSYKYDWNVKQSPEKTVFAESYGCDNLTVHVQSKAFTNYEIQGDSIKFISTKDIENMCLVITTVEVGFKRFK